jgi:hypothetical protein
MPVIFQKDDVVQVTGTPLAGHVLDVALSPDKTLQYLVQFRDLNGVDHQRWFEENVLAK